VIDVKIRLENGARRKKGYITELLGPARRQEGLKEGSQSIKDRCLMHGARCKKNKMHVTLSLSKGRVLS